MPNVTGNNTTRASNTIGYFLPPNLGGFYGQVMYGFSEQTKYDNGIYTPTARTMLALAVTSVAASATPTVLWTLRWLTAAARSVTTTTLARPPSTTR
jgi:hypothetical protein